MIAMAAPMSETNEDLNGMNALQLAAYFDCDALSRVMYFIGKLSPEKGQQMLNCKSLHRSQNLLHIAAKSSCGGLRYLLKHGCKDLVNETNQFEQIPLQVAVEEDAHDLVEILLKNGSKVSHKDGKGKTVFHIARSPSVMKLLLKYARPFQTDAKMKLLDAIVKRPQTGEILFDSWLQTNDKSLGSSDLLLVFDLTFFKVEHDSSGNDMVVHRKLNSKNIHKLLMHPLGNLRAL